MLQNFYDNVNYFLKNIKEENIKKLESHFQFMENKFDKSISRETWYVVGTRTRRLWTPIGDIIISRKIYVNRETGTYKILFDEAVGLKPYLYIQEDFYPMIMWCVNKVYSYKKLSKMFGYEISEWNICKAMKKGKLYFKPKVITEEVKALYVNVDGLFIKKWKDKKYEVKFALAFTGTKGNTKRAKLENKSLIPFKKDMATEDIAQLLFRYLELIYGQYKEIIFVGDGARWITSLSKEFLNSKRYIDQFHFTQFIKKFLPYKTKANWELIKYCKTKDLIFWLLHKISDISGEIKGLNKYRKDLLGKIRKFHESYKVCSSQGYINAIEAIQSHHMASILKGRRSFSKVVAEKIMMINCAAYNNWELTANPNEGISLENAWDYEKYNHYFKQVSFSNIPAFEYGSEAMATFVRNIINKK